MRSQSEIGNEMNNTSEEAITMVCSIVMPLYNNIADVGGAVHSVLEQTVSDFELIIVNDGSTDGSEILVRNIDDARIRIIDQKNSGVAAARNRGIEESRGEIIAFLDADDEWKKNFLETILLLQTKYPQCSVFATKYSYKEINNTYREPIIRKLPSKEWTGVIDNYFEIASHSDPLVWSSAVAVRKSALQAIGGFPVDIAIGEDLLTWAKLALRYEIAYTTTSCAVFRLRGPIAGMPTRKPELPDRVGNELQKIIPQVPHEIQKDFRRYIAMWHRMRAAMYIQLGEQRCALDEVRKIARYSLFNPQLYFYLMVALLPRWLRQTMLRIFSYLKIIRRKIIF